MLFGDIMAPAKVCEAIKKQQDMDETMKQVLSRLDELEGTCKKLKEENVKLKAEVSELKGETQKVATETAEVASEVGKVQVQQERHDKVMRGGNVVITGVVDSKEETEAESKTKVEEVLQNGIRLAASGNGSVVQATRLGKFVEGAEKPRPILVKCKSVESAGEILRNRSNLKGSDFEKVFVNPDRTPQERAKVGQAVREMWRLRQENPGVKAYVTMQGVLVVGEKGGKQIRREPMVSASPWAAEAAATKAAMLAEGSWVEVTRKGAGKRGGGSGPWADVPAGPSA